MPRSLRSGVLRNPSGYLEPPHSVRRLKITLIAQSPCSQNIFIVPPRIKEKRGAALVEYLEGILKIGNLVLALVAGFVALSLVKVSHKRKELRPWLFLIFGLVFFAVQEILGALRAFKIFESPFLTHINPAIILGLLIMALVSQLHLGGKR